MTWNAPLYMQDSELFSYAAADDRFIIDTLFTEGILNVQAGQGLAAQRPAGANMSVLVPPLDAIIKGDDAANQGSYLCRMTAEEYVTIPAPDATNPRIDLLIAELVDGQYRTTTTANPAGPRLRIVQGVAASSPVVPGLPATAIPLARIAVAANALSIQTANITDLRAQAGASTLKVGTQAEPLTATQIAALASAARFPGRLIENTSTGRLQHVVTAGAAPVDVASPIALGTIVDTTSVLDAAASSTLTKRIAVPAGVQRGILVAKSYGQSTVPGALVIFGSADLQAAGVGFLGGTSGATQVVSPNSRAGGDSYVAGASASFNTSGSTAFLRTVYVDTATSELVLVFQKSTGTTVAPINFYATYEVF